MPGFLSLHVGHSPASSPKSHAVSSRVLGQAMLFLEAQQGGPCLRDEWLLWFASSGRAHTEGLAFSQSSLGVETCDLLMQKHARLPMIQEHASFKVWTGARVVGLGGFEFEEQSWVGSDLG